MKKGWVLILLISLGLNLGLGIRLLADRGDPGGRGDTRQGREFRGWKNRWADRDSAARRQMHSRRLDRIGDELGLSPQQRESFGRVHQETGRLLMRQRVLISEKREALHSLVANEGINRESIRSIIAELGQEQAVLDSLVAETIMQEMDILEPGQRARYLEMLSFEQRGTGHRRGHGGRSERRQ